MDSMITKLLALSVGSVFFISLFVLFYVNPQTYHELNNLSIASFNIIGMEFRSVAALTLYAGTGILNIGFCIRLFGEKMNTPVGKISLLIAAICWSSLAIFPYDINDTITHHLLVLRIILFLTSSILGLLFISIDYGKVSHRPFMKWYTLSSAVLVCLLGFLSVFVYTDASWVRTNLSIVIYFTWHLFFGITRSRLPN